MVYKKQFVAAIKVAGKTLHEDGSQVKLPFKSEYSIYLKNQRNVNVMINIEIDGQHITPNGLVLAANSTSNLERFIESNRKFLFIERTSDIEAHRGAFSGDSKVVIKYSFEKPRADTFKLDQHIHHYYPQRVYWTQPQPQPQYPNTIIYSKDVSVDNTSLISTSNLHNSTGNIQCDVGITVEGSESNQTFDKVSSFDVEDTEYEIVFDLVGSEVVTTKTKKVCPSCGKKVKAKVKYCPDDGTYLG